MVGPMSFRQLNKTGMFFTVAAPGMDGVWSARLRGQSPCAVPEGHRTHQPPQTTTPPNSHRVCYTIYDKGNQPQRENRANRPPTDRHSCEPTKGRETTP